MLLRSFVVLLFTCFATVIHAAVISLNLSDGTSELTSGQVAGVVPAANWVNWTDPGNTATNTLSSLVDDSGNSVTGSIMISKSTGDTSNGASGAVIANGPNHVLMNQGFGGGGASAAANHGLYFRVSLPASFAQNGLNLYINSWSNLVPGTSGSARYAGIYQYAVDTNADLTLGSSSFVTNTTIGNTFVQNYNNPVTNFVGTYFNAQASTSTGAGPSNYVKIFIPASELTNNAGEVSFDFRVANLNIGAVSGADREWLNAIQIESVAVPEPSTMIAILVGAGALALLRRR
jgi:hypothetical protein